MKYILSFTKNHRKSYSINIVHNLLNSNGAGMILKKALWKQIQEARILLRFPRIKKKKGLIKRRPSHIKRKKIIRPQNITTYKPTKYNK